MTPIPKDPPLVSRVSRLRAALTHLLGSVLVVGCVAALVFGIWYPGPFRIHLSHCLVIVKMILASLALSIDRGV